MALLFQLLSEEDLRDLTVEQLEKLKAIFRHTLYTNPAIRRELSNKVSQALETMRAEQEPPQQSDVEKPGG